MQAVIINAARYLDGQWLHSGAAAGLSALDSYLTDRVAVVRTWL